MRFVFEWFFSLPTQKSWISFDLLKCPSWWWCQAVRRRVALAGSLRRTGIARRSVSKWRISTPGIAFTWPELKIPVPRGIWSAASAGHAESH